MPKLIQAQDNLEVLLGTWKLDLTPADPLDSKFASMEITEVKDNSISGYFYREGVPIRENNPLEVTIAHPQTGAPQTFRLTGSDLIAVFTAASTSEVAAIPYIINQLLQGDLSRVKEQLALLFQPPGQGAGMGMRLSVWCAEEYPFSDPAVIKKETNRYPAVAGLSPAVFNSSICEIWRVNKAPELENQAVESDIPVLLISGEYDNETPPKWARKMQQNMPNSYHLIFKGWKHTPTTYWSNPCGMRVANDFFNRPEQKPTPDCFESIQTPKFKTE